MKGFVSFKIILSIVLLLFFVQIAAADSPNWNLVGTYTWNFVCTSGCTGMQVCPHTMIINSQDAGGGFSGTGYTNTNPRLPWTATGTVSGSTFTLLIVYTVPPPGVSSYSASFTGTILPDGKLSGSGVTTVNERGNLVTTSGAATSSATTGQVSFDKKEYGEFAGVKWITVTDPDMNIDPNTEDNLFVDIDSVDAIAGKIIDQKIQYKLIETDKNSGVFKAGFLCTNVAPSEGTHSDGQYIYVNPAHRGAFAARYIDPVDANGNTNQLQPAQAIYDFSLHITITPGGRFIIPNPDAWGGMAEVPLLINVLQADIGVGGADIYTTSGNVYLGTTDENGVLDTKVPVSDFFTNPDPITLHAVKWELAGESDPVVPYEITKYDPKEYTVTLKDRLFYDTYVAGKQIGKSMINGFTTPKGLILQLLDFVPGVNEIKGIWDAGNTFVDLVLYFNYYASYVPNQGDLVHIDLVKFTNEPIDVTPAFVVRILVTRNGQPVIERHLWFEDTYLANQIMTKWRLLLRLDSPAVIYVTSMDGRHVGYAPDSGLLVEEIPAVIGSPGDEPFTMYLPYLDDGKYKIDIVGTGTGNYLFTAKSITSGGVEQEQSFSGSITKGEIDSYLAEYSGTGEIVISPANQPPNLVNPGDQTIAVGKTLYLNLVATDPDGDLLTYTFTPTLTGASISGNTFTWIPGSGTAGTYSVIFKATDTGALSDEETIKIIVNAPVTNVPTSIKIVPKTINLGSKGYFLAFATLPEAYKGATIDMKTVTCSGAKAVRMVRPKIFPRIAVFVFKTSDLQGVGGSNKVVLTLKGELKNKGTTYSFTGSDTVKVISKPSWQPEDINDLSKVSDDQLFKKYSI